MKPRATHTSFRKGTRIIIHFRDGAKKIAKFKEYKGRFIILDGGEKVRTDQLRNVGVYRPA